MRLTALTLLLAALVGCNDPSGPSGPAPGANEIRVGDNFFNPRDRTVTTGTTITFTWNSGSTSHNVTFADGPASPNQGSGNYQRLFNAAGSFAYSCTIHGGSMSGTITVN